MSAQRPYELARNAIWNILVLAPTRDARADFPFNVNVAKWRSENVEPLTQLYIQLEGQMNEGVFSKHVKALEQTVSACRQPLSASVILHDNQMPTTDQLCGVLQSGRPLVFDQRYGPHGGWLDPEPQTRAAGPTARHVSSEHQNYILPGFLGPFHGQYNSSNQRSLLKPEIARRVALMHGMTKGRWERQARGF
ncbi:hypothetical protein JCM10296v2_005769 [Rhodotorula toruloides]